MDKVFQYTVNQGLCPVCYKKKEECIGLDACFDRFTHRTRRQGTVVICPLCAEGLPPKTYPLHAGGCIARFQEELKARQTSRAATESTTTEPRPSTSGPLERVKSPPLQEAAGGKPAEGGQRQGTNRATSSGTSKGLPPVEYTGRELDGSPRATRPAETTRRPAATATASSRRPKEETAPAGRQRSRFRNASTQARVETRNASIQARPETRNASTQTHRIQLSPGEHVSFIAWTKETMEPLISWGEQHAASTSAPEVPPAAASATTRDPVRELRELLGEELAASFAGFLAKEKVE